MYYFLQPGKPQYFFPTEFKKHAVFLSFYKPYTHLGALSWKLFCNLRFYRKCFSIRSIETYIPEKKIRKIIGEETLMAFNTGTIGPEQKITGLGFENNAYYFIKYACTSVSMQNVINEHQILQQLSDLDFVPKVKEFYNDNTQVLLKTNVLEGVRLGDIKLNIAILKCLLNLSALKVKTKQVNNSKLKLSFAHGDFCPWNMMESDNQIMLYDWEMAGTYPAGYDLFTYIFQTSFFLTPKISFEKLLELNQKVIMNYFKALGIQDWKPYIVEFAKIKVDLETEKNSLKLKKKFEGLKLHVEKI